MTKMTEAQYQMAALSAAADMAEEGTVLVEPAGGVPIPGKVRKTPKTKGSFSFTGAAWTKSILAGSGIALKPANHPKLVAHAISLKVGAPSDLKKLKPTTLLSKVAAKLAA